MPKPITSVSSAITCTVSSQVCAVVGQFSNGREHMLHVSWRVLASCAFGQTDSCQLSVTFIACTLFWVYFALLQPNVSDSVSPLPSSVCLCLSGSLSDLWRLQAVVVIAFLVSGWLQLKPSAVFNCHCHFGLLGLGNATFGYFKAKCLTKHNLRITQCGSAA